MSEFDSAKPVVTNFQLTTIWKSGHSPMRDEFGFIHIDVGNGCKIIASLLRDGNLRLPHDVRIPLDMQQRVKRQAQQMAIRELAAEWDRQRDVDDTGRGIVGDAGEP